MTVLVIAKVMMLASQGVDIFTAFITRYVCTALTPKTLFQVEPAARWLTHLVRSVVVAAVILLQLHCAGQVQ